MQRYETLLEKRNLFKNPLLDKRISHEKVSQNPLVSVILAEILFFCFSLIIIQRLSTPQSACWQLRNLRRS